MVLISAKIQLVLIKSNKYLVVYIYINFKLFVSLNINYI